MVLSDWASVKRTRMDCAATTISGKEFGKSGVEIIRDEGGNDIFFAIRDDKEMAGTNGVKIVLPSWTWVNAWLGTVGTGSLFLYLNVHCLSFQCVSFGLLVQDHGQGGDRRRGTRWDILNEGGNDW